MTTLQPRKYARHELLALQSSPAVRRIPVGRGGNLIPRAFTYTPKVQSRGRTERSVVGISGRTGSSAIGTSSSSELPESIRGQLAAVQAQFEAMKRAQSQSRTGGEPSTTTTQEATTSSSSTPAATHVAVVSRRSQTAAGTRAVSLPTLPPQQTEGASSATLPSDAAAPVAAAVAHGNVRRSRSGTNRRRASSIPQLVRYPVPALNPAAPVWSPPAPQKQASAGAEAAGDEDAPFLRAPRALGADFVLPIAQVRPRRIVPPVAPDVFVFNCLRRATLAPSTVSALLQPSDAATLIGTAARRARSGRRQSPAMEDLGKGRRRLESITAIEAFVLELPKAAPSPVERSGSKQKRTVTPGDKPTDATAASTRGRSDATSTMDTKNTAATTGAKRVVGAALPVEKKKRRR